MLDNETRQKFGISYQTLATALSTPYIEPSTQDPVGFTARLLAREFVGSLEESVLGPVRDVLTNADLTSEQLGGVVSAVSRAGGNPSVQNSAADRLKNLLDELPGAIAAIKTGPMPPVEMVQPATAPASVAPALPSAPAAVTMSPEQQARILAFNFVGPVTQQVRKSLEIILKAAGVNNNDFKLVASNLYAIMGNNPTRKNTVNYRLDLLLKTLPAVIKNVTGHPLPSLADPNVKGAALLEAGANDLYREHLRAYKNNDISNKPDLGIIRSFLSKSADDMQLRQRILLKMQDIERIRKEENEKRQRLANPPGAGGAPQARVFHAPGGIDMNSHLLDLKEYSDGNNASALDEKILEATPIDEIFPRVLQLLPVTPGMLKILLG